MPQDLTSLLPADKIEVQKAAALVALGFPAVEPVLPAILVWLQDLNWPVAQVFTQWHFGMKAHIAADAHSGLVHTVTATAANESDVEQIADLLHGKEQDVWADSGYRGAQSRVTRDGLEWQIATRPSDMAKLPEGRAKERLKKQEHSKASVRAKVEHPFRVIKRQFGLAKVRFGALAKNAAHVVTLFALSNLWTARKKLTTTAGVVRPQTA